MKKTLLAGLIAACASFNAFALNTGDLAFASFNADEDGFSIVTFANIAANTTIFFRDDEWNGSAFNSGEGTHAWNTGASVIAAGTVVRFTKTDQASRAASVGSLTSSGDTGFNATSETVYAYIGSDANTPTTFLAGVSSEGATNLTPAGLVNGSNAVILTNSTDYASYNGSRSGQTSFAAYAPMVNNAANWNIVVGLDNAAAVPDTTAFSITPVPEADTWAMLLAGLGLMGFIGRRRGKSGTAA